LEELAEVIDFKLDRESLEEIDFINMLKEEYERDEKNQERGLYQLDKWVSRKLIKPYSQGFKAITVE
jgi:hypothetical protein